MRAHFGLPSVEAEDKEGKPPISVKFEIPYFTTSGIQVRARGAGPGADGATETRARSGPEEGGDTHHSSLGKGSRQVATALPPARAARPQQRGPFVYSALPCALPKPRVHSAPELEFEPLVSTHLSLWARLPGTSVGKLWGEESPGPSPGISGATL